MNFKPIISTKLYQQVIEQINHMIYSKKLKKGDKLPSERDMAVMFGISRTTVREALRSLEILGLIESRQGEGTFIAFSFPKYNALESLSLFFMLEGNTADLIEVRSMLEVECAGMAARAITPQELDKLSGYNQLLTGGYEGTAIEEADCMYHSFIAKASHNTMLNHMYASIYKVICYYIGNMWKIISKDANNTAILAEQHNRIYQALARQNNDQARKTMSIHMNYVYDQICLKLKNCLS